MPLHLAALVAAAVAAAPPAAAGAGAEKAEPGRGTILLGGERTEVRWTDGDTFRITAGPRRGTRVRLAGVNALETFGPVHRLGGMSGKELLAIARSTAALAAASEWTCETGGKLDAYGRLLASCPGAALALVRAGHAMVLAIDAPPEPALLEAQREAQRASAGMWARGAPPLVPTSLHSADLRRLRGGVRGRGCGAGVHDVRALRAAVPEPA